MESILSVILRINEYFNALDERKFDLCLDCFNETFDADYTSMVGGEPFKSLPRVANMAAWTGMLAGFKSTHHLIGNHEVKIIDSENCNVKAKVTATHCMGRENCADELWVTGGSYDFHMQKSSDGQWRINSVKYTQAWKTGSPELMQEASKICEQRGK